LEPGRGVVGEGKGLRSARVGGSGVVLGQSGGRAIADVEIGVTRNGGERGAEPAFVGRYRHLEYRPLAGLQLYLLGRPEAGQSENREDPERTPHFLKIA
jgi:hypothetical protein